MKGKKNLYIKLSKKHECICDSTSSSSYHARKDHQTQEAGILTYMLFDFGI